jgi:hypothetical protein
MHNSGGSASSVASEESNGDTSDELSGYFYTARSSDLMNMDSQDRQCQIALSSAPPDRFYGLVST